VLYEACIGVFCHFFSSSEKSGFDVFDVFDVLM